MLGPFGLGSSVGGVGSEGWAPQGSSGVGAVVIVPHVRRGSGVFLPRLV
jgi:hypothetical protein